MSKEPRIRVQIAGAAWLDALKSSFIADNEHWFEQRVHGGRGSAYVAYLDPQTALMVAHALEGQVKMIFSDGNPSDANNRRVSMGRTVLRIRADAAVEGFRDE